VEHDFDSILGNDVIKRSMMAAIRHERVPHASIICGGAGFGKRMLAGAFARAVLCFAPVDGAACGTCTSCRTFDTGNNPDLVRIAPQKSTLGVDEVRSSIVADLAVLPYSSTKRVYIIEAAHKMTIPAQNAMLLTLEEGPRHAVFILLANNIESFLPTILSRCVLYKIPPLSEGIIAARTSAVAARFAQGSLGRALQLNADENFMQLRQMTLDLATNIANMDIPAIFAAAKDLEQHKVNIHDTLDILKLHYRDNMLAGDPAAVAHINAIGVTLEKLAANCPFLLCMETLLLKLSGENHD